jgi:hypothetical protein
MYKPSPLKCQLRRRDRRIAAATKATLSESRCERTSLASNSVDALLGGGQRGNPGRIENPIALC